MNPSFSQSIPPDWITDISNPVGAVGSKAHRQLFRQPLIVQKEKCYKKADYLIRTSIRVVIERPPPFSIPAELNDVLECDFIDSNTRSPPL